MEKEAVLAKIEDCITRLDINGLGKHVDELITTTDEDTAGLLLSQQILNRYTTFRADSLAKVLEVIIRKKPNLAMIRFPQNYFFRLAVMIGSVDLYECYIEEASNRH